MSLNPFTDTTLILDSSLDYHECQESALVSDISHLEVDPNTAFNTPTTGTPIPMSKMSSETLALLDEAAFKLKNFENQSAKVVKRKRSSSLSGDRQSSSRDRYPPESKPLVL